MSPSIKKRIDETARSTGETMSDIIRRAMDEFYAPKEALPQADDPALHQVRLKYLSRLPCGPLKESIAEASDFVISGDIADTLDISRTDFVVMAEGESMMGPKMDGGDIIDGDYLILRPQDERRNPPSGKIVLAQVVTPEGVAEATIKFWNNGASVDAPDFLTDGQGERVELPEGELRPVGVLRALLRKY